MSSLSERIQWQTSPGTPVTAGDVTVTPQSRALTVRWPRGGLVWNRPVAVLVEQDGRTEHIPIIDVTRIAQLTLLGLSLFFFAVAIALSIRQGRGRNE